MASVIEKLPLLEKGHWSWEKVAKPATWWEKYAGKGTWVSEESPLQQLERQGIQSGGLAAGFGLEKRGETITRGAQVTKEPGLKIAYDQLAADVLKNLQTAETKKDAALTLTAMRTIDPEQVGITKAAWMDAITAGEAKMAALPEKTATETTMDATNPINTALQGIGSTIGRAPGALAAGLGSGLTAGFMGGSGSKGAGINWSAILGVAVVGGSLYYLLKSKAGAEDKVKKAVTA